MRFSALLLLLGPALAACATLEAPQLVDPIVIGGTTTKVEDLYVWDGYVTVTIPPLDEDFVVEVQWSPGLQHETQGYPRRIELSSRTAETVERQQTRAHTFPLKLTSRSAPVDEFVRGKLPWRPHDFYDVERVRYEE